VISGVLGLFWTAWWRLSYFSPEQDPEANDSDDGESAANLRWLDRLRIRQVWGMVAAKFLSDGVWVSPSLRRRCKISELSNNKREEQIQIL
jgi:hypothetical protein